MTISSKNLELLAKLASGKFTTLFHPDFYCCIHAILASLLLLYNLLKKANISAILDILSWKAHESFLYKIYIFLLFCPLYRGKKLIRPKKNDRYIEITGISKASIIGEFNTIKAWKNSGPEHLVQYNRMVGISVDTKVGLYCTHS